MNGNIDDYYDEINNTGGVKSVNQIYMRNGFIKNGSNFKEYMRIIGGNYEQLSYVLEPQLLEPIKDKIDNIKSNEVVVTE
ncbi:hypothetical protein EOM82_06810, partial [bacterium]|nr:hypothetical protein [bacterium]